jgi:hypothetical protein
MLIGEGDKVARMSDNILLITKKILLSNKENLD